MIVTPRSTSVSTLASSIRDANIKILAITTVTSRTTHCKIEFFQDVYDSKNLAQAKETMAGGGGAGAKQ